MAIAGLDLLRAVGWLVLHDVAVPGEVEVPIDHVLAGPSGVYAINTINGSGAIRMDESTLLIGGVSQLAHVEDVASAALALREAIGGRPVVPILCFQRPDEVAGVVAKVAVCSTENILELLNSQPTMLDSGAANDVMRTLTSTLSRQTTARSVAMSDVPAVKPKHKVRKRLFGRATEETDAGPVELSVVAPLVVPPVAAPVAPPVAPAVVPAAAPPVDEAVEQAEAKRALAEAEQIEAERVAAEEAARAEAERVEAERVEAERLAAEEAAAEAARVEAERLAAEEAARVEAERVEAERLAAEEAARVEAERLAAEEAARVEAERLAAEEAARLEAERVEAERLAAEEAARLEAERLAAEEAARLEAARVEAERLAAEEAARVEAERVEAERLAAEEAARVEAERVEAERLAAEEAARLEAERVEAERLAAEEAARLEAARVEAERLAAEEAARLEAERVEAERLAAEEAARVEAERLAAEEAARLEAARVEAERLAAEEAARVEAERVEAERLAAEEAARLEAEEAARQEAERAAAEAALLEAERLAAEVARLEQERAAAQRAARAAVEEAARVAARLETDTTPRPTPARVKSPSDELAEAAEAAPDAPEPVADDVAEDAVDENAVAQVADVAQVARQTRGRDSEDPVWRPIGPAAKRVDVKSAIKMVSAAFARRDEEPEFDLAEIEATYQDDEPAKASVPAWFGAATTAPARETEAARAPAAPAGEAPAKKRRISLLPAVMAAVVIAVIFGVAPRIPDAYAWGKAFFVTPPPPSLGQAAVLAQTGSHPAIEMMVGIPVDVRSVNGVSAGKGRHLVGVPIRATSQGATNWRMPVASGFRVVDTLGIAHAPDAKVTRVRSGTVLRGHATLAPGRTVSGMVVFAIQNGRDVSTVKVTLASSEQAHLWNAVTGGKN